MSEIDAEVRDYYQEVVSGKKNYQPGNLDQENAEVVDQCLDRYFELKQRTMTDEEKGYTCPDDCEHCEVKNTLCIVFSKAGRKKYENWKKSSKPVSLPGDIECEDGWHQPALFD